MYHEPAGVRSLVLAMSHLELIASCPPSRPRNGTTSCTVTASLTRGLRVLRMFRQSRLFDGGCHHRLVAALLTVLLWLVWCVPPHSEESSFRPDGMVRTLCRNFSSTASGEGLTNDCSDGALPNPESSNNPELNCVFPLNNAFDFAGLEDLEGLKVDNMLLQKIASSSRWSRYTQRCLPPAEGAQ